MSPILNWQLPLSSFIKNFHRLIAFIEICKQIWRISSKYPSTSLIVRHQKISFLHNTIPTALTKSNIIANIIYLTKISNSHDNSLTQMYISPCKKLQVRNFQLPERNKNVFQIILLSSNKIHDQRRNWKQKIPFKLKSEIMGDLSRLNREKRDDHSSTLALKKRSVTSDTC